MFIEKTLVTPEIAADMLTRNDGNRPMRPEELLNHLERMRQNTGDKE